MARHGRALLIATALLCGTVAKAENITLENEYVRYVLSPQGRSVSFLDKRTGKERCADPGRRAFAAVRKGGAQHNATACTFADGRLTVQFGKAGVTAVLKATAKKHYFVFEVVSVHGAGADEIVLTNLAVTPGKHVSGMSGVAADDSFAAAVRGLNLQVRTSVGGRPVVLSARCYRKYGLVGARVALVGCPVGKIRPVLQEVIRAEGLPYSPLGGPFALDAEENRGSYVFAQVSEKNVDAWIALAKKAGLTQIHLNGWSRSLGHYEPRKSLFPSGLAGLKSVIDKIHAAGLKAGMHTLTGCISPHDSWVTPTPDKRLATDASYTLAAEIDEKAARLPTLEQPGQFDTVWAYGGHGNVVRIDDELIHFTRLAREKPYAFDACRRGAFGTKPAPHKKGAAVGHLYARYGCFQPAEESTLVDDVADAIAAVFNTCGFDMIYMDGAEGMIGGWHGVAKMREVLFRRLKRRTLVEASEWGNPSWPFHSRIGAWDYPNWGLKQFIDVHCRATEQYRRTSLLPAQLGWWAVFGPNRHHDAELPDEIEYLCCKSLALDAPMSFQALSPTGRPQNARQDEYLEMIGTYERLRLSGRVPPSVRQRLGPAGAEFRLVRADGGTWRFLPTDYAAHKVTALDDASAAWTVTNRFGAQPAKLRITALHAAEPYDSPAALVLADFAKADEFPVRAAAAGVTATLAASSEHVKAGKVSGRFAAKSAAKSRRGAWARAGKTFSPHANMAKHDAIGLWIHGDGRGELLNVQLASPRQYYRAIDEHYVRIDFKGWRYVELLLRERDADRFGDFVWPYGGHYHVFRAPLVRSHVSELNLYFNLLPPGAEAACLLSPPKALGVRKIKLTNPAVEIAGKRIVFPVTLESGCYIEMESPSDCRLHDARGALVRKITPQGAPPLVPAGPSPATFTCQPPASGLRARARVTLITTGKPLAWDQPRQ